MLVARPDARRLDGRLFGLRLSERELHLLPFQTGLWRRATPKFMFKGEGRRDLSSAVLPTLGAGTLLFCSLCWPTCSPSASGWTQRVELGLAFGVDGQVGRKSPPLRM